MDKNSDINTVKKVRPQNKNLRPPMKKGETINPNGRPLGRRNIKTILFEAMVKIGETRGMSPEEVELLMHQAGIKKAMTGNFAFYKEITDRMHGKQKDTEINLTVNNENNEEVLDLTKKLNELYRK